MIKKYIRKFENKVSISFLRGQVLKNAYGNTHTFIARLDPRVLLLWYAFFAIIPWVTHDVTLLFMFFLIVLITAIIAKIAPLILFLFAFGVFTQTGTLFFVALFFGGSTETILPLLILTLKIVTVSLASLTVFSGLEPDRLSLGFLWFGCPEQFVFSVSLGYKMLPALLDEYQNIMFSYRLRGKAIDHKRLKGKFLYIIYRMKIIVLSFYPLMLNMAKRSRTITEALMLKGYFHSLKNPAIKRMKLSALRLQKRDKIFVCISVFWVIISVLLSVVINEIVLSVP